MTPKLVPLRYLPDLQNKTHRIVEALHQAGIEVLGNASVHESHPSVRLFGDEETWYEQFLSAKMVVAIVSNIDEAIEKINQYSGGHSAAIVTESKEKAEKFMREVDSAAVYHNASTRFTDGGEFGLGAEIAISTIT